MITQLLARVSRRYHARWHRGVMRGYRRLKHEGRLGWVDDCRRTLAGTSASDNIKVSQTFFGAATAQAQLAIQQYLMVSVDSMGLFQALLFVHSKDESVFIFPLPRPWRKALKEEGVPVAELRSRIAWFIFVCGMFVYGLLAIAKYGLSAARSRKTPTLSQTAFFDALGPGNLPRTDGGKSYDIFSWYEAWPDRSPDVTGLAHTIAGGGDRSVSGLSLQYRPNAISYPRSLRGYAAVARILVSEIAISLFDLLRGRWWHSLMLSEGVKSAMVRCADPGDLASDYLFHNSGWVYRPIWTYEAEKRGSRVLFYFYSTNCETFKRKEGYPAQTGYWELCTWPVWLVWDQAQAEFVWRAVGKADVRIVGAIWFADNALELPDIPANTVAVFDVQPMRSSIYEGLALPTEYYVPEVACRFAEDVFQVCSDLDTAVTWKRKRDVGKRVHQAYGKLLKQADNVVDFVEIVPSIAAQHVIGNDGVCCVVSMPFTSTALAARAMSKPSCYYDPSGIVQPDDRAAHDIVVIQSRDALKCWIEENMGTNSEPLKGANE